MKRLLLITCMAALCASCSQNTSSQRIDNTPTAAGVDASALSPSNMTREEIIAKMDPVCEMVRDDSWTDSMAFEGATVHFCSETCKNAFEAQPTTYLK